MSDVKSLVSKRNHLGNGNSKNKEAKKHRAITYYHPRTDETELSFPGERKPREARHRCHGHMRQRFKGAETQANRY
jgi:hypothetical protein